MRIATDDILHLEPAAEIRCGERRFDYVDIVGFSAKPAIPPQASVLWCATRSTTPEDLSWYGVSFDRGRRAAEVSEGHPDWVVLTDDTRIAGATADRCIRVPRLMEFLERLHRRVLHAVGPVVVGVTGSVGKTTCAALCEDVLSQYGATLRLYAKRITPLSLFEMVINQLEAAHRYVVMEYAMFHAWHIAELVRLIEPTVGILLNVEEEHLGVDGISSARDVLIAKKELLERSSHSLVEQDVARRFEADLAGITEFAWRDFVKPRGFDVEPFVRSRLQYVQIGAVLSVKELLVGPVTPADIAAVERFQPKEKRLLKVRCRRHHVFFDGELTAPVRLKALGDTLYPAQALAVHAVSDWDEYYEQDLTLQAELLRSALRQFGSIYVSGAVEALFRSFVEECSSGGTSVVPYDDRFPGLEPDVTLFVHWGGYWRRHGDDSAVVETF